MDPITIVLSALVALSAIPSVATHAPDRIALTAGVTTEPFQWGQLAGPHVGLAAPLKRGRNLRAEAAVKMMHTSRDYAYAVCHLLRTPACEGHDDYRAIQANLRIEPTRTWTGVMRPYVSVGYQMGTVRTSEFGYGSLSHTKNVSSIRRPVWGMGVHWANHMVGLPLALDIGITPRASWTRDYLRMDSSIGFWY